MPLGRTRDPFSHLEWLYEIRWDGFRSLAYVHSGACRLISRNGNQFKSFPALAESLPAELRARSAVLDGEIVCLDRHGETHFKDLLFRRGEPRFYAFDLLWCDGDDLRCLPLIDRKLQLRSIVPHHGGRLLYCDHVDGDGEKLFRLACQHDLEGVVAKWKSGPYLQERPTSWIKIRNQGYSQWVGREELFERERGGDPDFRGWDECVRTAANSGGLRCQM
jgi:bifunctional non-homologous end joining protein LigD